MGTKEGAKVMAKNLKKGELVQVKGGQGWGNAIGKVKGVKQYPGFKSVRVEFKGNLPKRKPYKSSRDGRMIYPSNSGSYTFSPSQLKRRTAKTPYKPKKGRRK